MNFKRSFYFLCHCLLVVSLFSSPAILRAVVVECLVPVIVAKLPHDRQAFTQGLAVEEDQLYESTGLYGQSSLRHLDILTGKILHKYSLSSAVFAEGLAAFPQRLLQITWREKQVFVYERSSLRLLQVLFYSGEGWGLCRDENKVWMSNGTSTLTQRDLQSFAILKTLDVHWKEQPITRLNDLECDGHYLYANVWQKDWLVRIDKMTGEVTGIIDGSQLLSPLEKAFLGPEEVLNGIAFRPKTGTFFLTGKGWPWIFEVRLISQKM
jgi:glutamine cyclotransferase